MVHAPREVVTSIMVVCVGEIVLALILVRLILIVNRLSRAHTHVIDK